MKKIFSVVSVIAALSASLAGWWFRPLPQNSTPSPQPTSLYLDIVVVVNGTPYLLSSMTPRPTYPVVTLPTPTRIPPSTPTRIYVTPTPTNLPDPAAVYYTVAPGDSLWKISLKYGATVDALRLMNAAQYPTLKENTVIQIGWVLRVK